MFDRSAVLHLRSNVLVLLLLDLLLQVGLLDAVNQLFLNVQTHEPVLLLFVLDHRVLELLLLPRDVVSEFLDRLVGFVLKGGVRSPSAVELRLVTAP